MGLIVLQVATGAALLALVASCADLRGPQTVEVGDARAYVGEEPVVGASSAERFGFGPLPEAPSVAGPSVPESAFSYDLPEGWTSQPPTSMRAVNLQVARDPRAECTLVLLGGDAGGLGPNVDRWRGQMGLGPATELQLSALPPATLLGADAVRVDFAGDYTGMSGGGSAGFRMVGLLAVAPEGSAFLKFVGPAAVVGEELAAFDALAASLAVASDEPPAPASEADASPVRWTAPATWTAGAPRMMREVTFTTDPEGTVECYITVLGGDGGGIRSNLDRWRNQMGASPLTTEELAGLERIDCLDSTAVLIEIAGGFEGMAGEQVDDALLFGAVASLESRTVFVKLIGPRAAAEGERERFRQFVQSLERVR